MALWEEPMDVQDNSELSLPQDGFSIVDLKAESMKFKNCAKQVYDSMSQSRTEILHIVEVQNPALWEAYLEKKAQMEEQHSCFPVRECELFHGTSRDAVVSICRNGFDPGRCGKHATKYGKGCYFARDAAYSHMYTDHHSGIPGIIPQSHSVIQYLQQTRNPKHNILQVLNTMAPVPAEESSEQDLGTRQHTHFMFLARVLVGHFTPGKSFFTKPPEMDPANPLSQKYDSCSDAVFGPKIFTIFDSAQCYPEYVIEYTHQRGHR